MAESQFENIPQEMRQGRQWLLWRRETVSGRVTKVPYRLDGEKAGSNRPTDWNSFEEAVLALDRGFDGIGAALANGFCAIDIDHCVTDGQIDGRAQSIIALMQSYTELSPSGTGVHIYFKAPGFTFDKQKYYIKPSKGDGAGLEVYLCGATYKYLTVTGNRLEAYEYEERPGQLQTFLDTFMLRPGGYTPPVEFQEDTLSVGLEKDRTLRDLWNGRRAHGDESADDMALMNKLAYWCNRSVDQCCFARQLQKSCAKPAKTEERLKGV